MYLQVVERAIARMLAAVVQYLSYYHFSPLFLSLSPSEKIGSFKAPAVNESCEESRNGVVNFTLLAPPSTKFPVNPKIKFNLHSN
jgi:hypothetical protein